MFQDLKQIADKLAHSEAQSEALWACIVAIFE